MASSSSVSTQHDYTSDVHHTNSSSITAATTLMSELSLSSNGSTALDGTTIVGETTSGFGNGTNLHGPHSMTLALKEYLKPKWDTNDWDIESAEHMALIHLQHRQTAQPSPLYSRTHGTGFFARTSLYPHEPLTCFLCITGNANLIDFAPDGKFHSVTLLASYLATYEDARGVKLYTRFDNVKDAQKGLYMIRRLGNTESKPIDVIAMCVSAEEFVAGSVGPNDNGSDHKPLSMTYLTGYDGQVLIQAHALGDHASGVAMMSSGNETDLDIKKWCSGFGEVKEISRVYDDPRNKNKTLMWLVEMSAPETADDIVLSTGVSGIPYQRVQMFGVYVSPSTISYVLEDNAFPSFVLNDQEINFRYRWWGACSVMQGPRPYANHINPYPRLQRPYIIGLANDLYDVELYFTHGIQFLHTQIGPRGGRGRNNVDLDEILRGRDMRTTIMIRNIPNRYDLDILKERIDEVSKYRYDFLYLRIDFSNGHNVGYAFINFIAPEHILKFVNTFVGKQWPGSTKFAEVSYATMQGREALIEKFRNSSVMQEAPSCRPKLYFAGDHPRSGQEEPFPTPNNFTKLLRSKQNAQYIGLYPSVRGGHGSHSRYRPGMFDRGTSFAQYEEFSIRPRPYAGYERLQGGFQMI